MPRVARALTTILSLTLISACYAPRIEKDRAYHPSDADLTVTRIVHATVILDFRGEKILVDPWYATTPPFGPGEAIGLALEKLPPLKGIAITSNRIGHLDLTSLASLPDKSIRVVVPKGLGDDLEGVGYKDVVEMEPWEQTKIGDVSISSVPAKVGGSGENGYVVEAYGVRAYVAGVVRFDPKLFWSIAEGFPSLDLAILPAGGIRLFGFRLDLSADEASKVFGILKPTRIMPYGYALVAPFPMLTSPETPVQDLVVAMEARFPKSRRSIIALAPGESWHDYR